MKNLKESLKEVKNNIQDLDNFVKIIDVVYFKANVWITELENFIKKELDEIILKKDKCLGNSMTIEFLDEKSQIYIEVKFSINKEISYTSQFEKFCKRTNFYKKQIQFSYKENSEKSEVFHINYENLSNNKIKIIKEMEKVDFKNLKLICFKNNIFAQRVNSDMKYRLQSSMNNNLCYNEIKNIINESDKFDKERFLLIEKIFKKDVSYNMSGFTMDSCCPSTPECAG